PRPDERGKVPAAQKAQIARRHHRHLVSTTPDPIHCWKKLTAAESQWRPSILAGANAAPPMAYFRPTASPPIATEPAANPPIETPRPIAAPPKANIRPNDAPPRLNRPHARPPMATAPTAMLPIAITPFATRGRIVTGSIPAQTWSSGHDPMLIVDRYSNPNIVGICR